MRTRSGARYADERRRQIEREKEREEKRKKSRQEKAKPAYIRGEKEAIFLQKLGKSMSDIGTRRLQLNLDPIPPLPDDESFDEEQPQEERKRYKMGDLLNKIEKLKMDGNLSENWRRFKRYFNIFMAAGELNDKADVVKINTFLNCIGEEAVEVFDTFTLTDNQIASYDEVIKAFEEFCKPKKNTIYERFMFYQRKQKANEPFDAFLMDLKKLSRNCEFADKEKEMIRDQIVMGVQDKKLQLRLLEKNDLTYDTAVEKGRQSETTREQVDTMCSKISDVNELQHRYSNHVADKRNNGISSGSKAQYNRNSNTNTNDNNNGKRQQNQQRQNETKNRNQNNESKSNDRCKYCKLAHKFGTKNCPAFGKKCNSCSKANHFASVCRFKKDVSAISCNDSNYDFDDNSEFLISILSDENETVYPWTEKIRILKSSVTFKIDTGAGVDVLPINVLKRIVPQAELQRTSITLRAFAGETIKPIGTYSLICDFHNVSIKVKFAIVDFDCTPILGLKTCMRWKIVQPSRTFRNSMKENL